MCYRLIAYVWHHIALYKRKSLTQHDLSAKTNPRQRVAVDQNIAGGLAAMCLATTDLHDKHISLICHNNVNPKQHDIGRVIDVYK